MEESQVDPTDLKRKLDTITKMVDKIYEPNSDEDVPEPKRQKIDEEMDLREQLNHIQSMLQSMNAVKDTKITTTVNGGAMNRKQRVQSLVLNLKQFVHLLLNNYIHVTVSDDGQVKIPNKPLLHLVNVPGGNDVLREIIRNDTVLKSSINDVEQLKFDKFIVTPETRNKELEPKAKESMRKRIFFALLMRMLDEVERANVKLQFSVEMLKILLALNDILLTPDVFITTNRIKTTNKSSDDANTMTEKRKNKLNLPGAILQEISKGPDAFSVAMAQADEQDIDALRIISVWQIRLPIDTILKYCNNYCGGLNFPIIQYEPIDSSVSISLNNEYTKIQMASFKHVIVLVTPQFVLVLENGTFIVCPLTVEKDIPTSVLLTENLNYAVFDILLSAKNKVLDILALSMNKDANNKPIETPLPERFQDRLRLVQELFPGLKCVNTTSNVDDMSNCLYKPNIGYGTVYTFTKPNFVGAIVAMSDNDVYVAGLESEDCLSVVNKYTIIGNYSFPIMLHRAKEIELRRKRAKSTPEDNELRPTRIKYNDKEYNLTKLPNVTNLMVFSEVLKVEIRDGNKLGGYSKHEISSVQNMKMEPTEENLKSVLNVMNQRPQELLALLLKHWESSSFVKVLKQCDKLDNVQLQNNYTNM